MPVNRFILCLTVQDINATQTSLHLLMSNTSTRVLKCYSSSLEAVEQSLTNAADGTEGGAVWERLYEVLAFLYTGAERRIQGH